jgi:hypothetical protein
MCNADPARWAGLRDYRPVGPKAWDSLYRADNYCLVLSAAGAVANVSAMKVVAMTDRGPPGGEANDSLNRLHGVALDAPVQSFRFKVQRNEPSIRVHWCAFVVPTGKLPNEAIREIRRPKHPTSERIPKTRRPNRCSMPNSFFYQTKPFREG